MFGFHFPSPHVKWAFYAVAVVVALSLITKWMACQPSYSAKFKRPLKSMVREASRHHLKAQQDSNPLVALLNSNTALTYAKISRALANDTDIENATGIKVNELLYYLEKDQERSIQNIVKECPTIKPEGIYGVGSGWI